MTLKLTHRYSAFRSRASTLVLIAAIASLTQAAEAVRPWKATPTRPYVLRGAERRLLDRAEQFLTAEQWDDAVTAVMRLLETDDFSVVAVSEQRFVSLPEYCHRLLATLPREPLAHYRALVDATAESWYRQGIEKRDQTMMQRVVDKYFCSRWGDEALFALGELALQRGDYQAARNAWLQINPQLEENSSRLTYPDTDQLLAAVRARLVLVSIREGDWRRAERELAELRKDYPKAIGRLGGREVVFAEQLASLLKQARRWPSVAAPEDWRTFAANSQRTNTHAAPNPAGPYELVWSQPIANKQLSIFPVVVNDLVVYLDAAAVRALRLTDGEPVFTAESDVLRLPKVPGGCLGQPHYSLTATDRFLFGVTTVPLGLRHRSEGAGVPSVLWSLDLQRDGAMAFLRPSDDASVAFVGAPVVVGTRVFVPIRSHDQTARAGVACYDLRTGERNWQRWLCRANTPATGWTSEIVSNLLTYDSGILYVNTNLGAIAAIRAADGQVVWLRTYERQSAALDSAGNYAYYRGPSPCVFYRGVIVACPTDSASLFALDATTGRELWRRVAVAKSPRFFGIREGNVVLSSERLQICDLRSGEMLGTLEDLWSGLPSTGQADRFSVGEYAIVAEKKQLSVYRYKDRNTNILQDKQLPSKE